MTNNILLLGFTVPQSLARTLSQLDTRPAIQTYKFSWSLARALECGVGRVFLASAFPIQNYPYGRQVVFRGTSFREHGMEGVMLGFINLIVLKHITRFLSCLLTLPRFIRRNEVRWIVVHGVHSPFLLFGALAKLFGVRLLVMLTDSPGVILATDGPLARMLKRLDQWIVRALLRAADGMMCLSPAMVDHFGITQPVICFPGILSSDFVQSIQDAAASVDTEQCEEVRVVYAGGLNRTYGVRNLVEAVSGIESPPIKLYLFGRGDQEQEILERSFVDERIFFGGFVDEQSLVPALLGADILINPRPAEQSFAILSFPSKLIEYLATGRPILTTRIASIPQSFQRYFSFIESGTPEDIRTGILRLIQSYERSQRTAAEGARAVFEQLTERVIGGRMAALVAEISASRTRNT